MSSDVDEAMNKKPPVQSTRASFSRKDSIRGFRVRTKGTVTL